MSVDPRDDYPIPAGPVRVEQEIERSRFIATLDVAASADGARMRVDEIAAEYSDATHNCSAWVIGPPGSTRCVGASDDGEPSGTAGRPMLGVLLGSDVGDVMVVVTRYFGGVKLGKGGLVRAYSSTVQMALRAMKVTRHVSYEKLRVTIPYAAVEVLRRIASEHDAPVDDEAFAEQVTIALRVPRAQIASFTQAVTDATGGAATFGASD